MTKSTDNPVRDAAQSAFGALVGNRKSAAPVMQRNRSGPPRVSTQAARALIEALGGKATPLPDVPDIVWRGMVDSWYLQWVAFEGVEAADEALARQDWKLPEKAKEAADRIDQAIRRALKDDGVEALNRSSGVGHWHRRQLAARAILLDALDASDAELRRHNLKRLDVGGVVAATRYGELARLLDSLSRAQLIAIWESRQSFWRLKEFEFAQDVADMYVAGRVVSVGRKIQAVKGRAPPGRPPIDIDKAAFLEDYRRDFLPAAKGGRAGEVRLQICEKYGIGKDKFYKLRDEAQGAGLLDSREPLPAARAAGPAKRVR